MSKKYLPFISILFLVHLFIRAVNILAQDPYVDEGFHLKRATFIYDFAINPGRVSHGKVGLYFWLGLFEADKTVILVPGRLSIALFSMLTAAVIFLLVKRFSGPRVALLAMAFYAFMPLAVWYERLAFADPYAGALAALLVWRSVLFARRPNWQQGAIIGVLIGMATTAKLTTGLMPALPVLASLLLGKNLWRSLQPQDFAAQLGAWVWRWWQTYGWYLLEAALITVLIWAPMAIPAYLAKDSDDPFILVNPVNYGRDGEETKATPIEYLEEVWPALEDYTSENFFWALLVAGVLVVLIGNGKQRREGLFVVAWLGAITLLTIATATLPSVRYLMVLAAPAVVILGMAMGRLAAVPWLRYVATPALVLLAIFYIANHALPFLEVATDDPHELDFHAANWINFQSGQLSADDTTRQAAYYYNAIRDTEDHIYATWTLCHLLFFYIDGDFTCLPDDNPNPLVGLRQHIADDIAPGDGAYVATMAYPPFVTWIDEIESTELVVATRPNRLRPITLWRIDVPATSSAQAVSQK